MSFVPFLPCHENSQYDGLVARSMTVITMITTVMTVITTMMTVITTVL
jgi:hypothetical protein